MNDASTATEVRPLRIAARRDRTAAMNAGFDVHMVKPLDLDALQALLAKLPVAP